MQETTAGPAHGGTGSVTIADIVGLAAERYGERPAARFKRDGEWREVSYTRARRDGLRDRPRADRPRPRSRRPRRAAVHDPRRVDVRGLRDHRPPARVVVPIYPTNSPEECAWVAGNSESRFIVCEDASQVAKIVAVRDQLPKLEAIIAIEPADGAISLDELRERGRARDAARGRRAHRRGQARGPVHDHLHVGDDRAAQGLRADPRQLPPGHPHVRGDRRHRGGRARLPLPAARALLRAADPAAGASTSARR